MSNPPLSNTTRNPQRQKDSADIRGAQNIVERAYNEDAGAIKSLPILGSLAPLGAANVTPIQMPDSGQTVALYNDSTSTAFVAIANTQADLPGTLNGTTSMAIPPQRYITLSMGSAGMWVSTSAATVYVYLVNDETYWR